MKKYLFPALALGLVMTSCQSDEPFAPVEGGEKQVTFTLNVPGELGTRAGATDNASDKGGFSNGQGTLYYTLVLDANGDTRVFKDATVSNDGRTATFTPTVVLGRDYTITAYASFDDNSSIDEINDIRTISVSKKFNDESKDAYFQTITHNFAEGDLQPLTLTRPFGKLRLVATDYKATGNGNTAIKSVKVKYNNNVFTTFNAVSGEFSNGQSYEHTLDGTNYSTSYYAPEKDENGNVTGQTIFADYVPVNSTGVAPFEITIVYVDGDEEYTRKFNQDIPVRRNALTTLKGNFFTAGAEIKVEVKDAFEGQPENINFVSVSNASQLQDAINNGGNGETIILTDDIVLTEPLVFGGNSGNPAPTRSGVANSFVLNLNDNNISGTDSGTASYGLITIKKGADLTIEGNGAISLTATQDRGWNAYSSVISNQQGKLTVNGGTIQHNGGTAMAYAIDNLTNGKGTYAETIINGGTIKSTYRAIRQFLNGVEAQNILTVNGGTIESTGGNKSIWMQDASAKANSGTLNVYGDASINSAIYIDGNTSWDVEAYIEKAALKNGSTVITENVPAGYSVIEDNEVVKVINAVAVSNADQLVEALQNGYNVYFLNDITVVATEGGYNKAGILQNKAQTIDGGGHTLTVTGAGATWDCAIYTNGGTIKNLTVAGSFRGIFTGGQNSDLYIENVEFKEVIYTFNSDGTMPTNPFGVYVSNSVVNGWTSHSDMHTEVVYTNCSFGEGSGYKFCRPYGKTSFVKCTFCPGYKVDDSQTDDITFENCTFQE